MNLAPVEAHELKARAVSLGPRIGEIRRAIHRRPELGLNNPRTQALIIEELKRIGIPVLAKGKGCTSVVAEIEGNGPGACIALRADMDALPLSEHGSCEWASEVEGAMHACGHDGHVAMLLGAAEILADNRERFAGRVRLLFQPGEEGYGGARVMIDEGALEGVDAAFAVHLEPSTPTHVVAWRRGTILASADVFTVTFQGAGGHGSMPHLARDPIPAVGPFVDGLANVVARETDPDDRVVLSVTRVDAGTTMNVIPPEAVCAGTVRALSEAGRERAHAALERVASGVAQSRGLKAQVSLVRGYPATVNDGGRALRAARVAGELGLKTLEMPSAVMGAEDYSYILARVPGCMVFLGCQTPGGGPLHSDQMKVDEEALATGAALHAAVAADFLTTDLNRACP